MRLPHQIVRRVALLAAVIAGPTLTACSNEGPLAPQAPARAAVPGGNQTGFVVGWGVTGDSNGAGTQGVGSTGTTSVDETRGPQPIADSTGKVLVPVKAFVGRR